MFFPMKHHLNKTYEEVLNDFLDKADQRTYTIREYTDYDKKIHLIKVRNLEDGPEFYSYMRR